jgi:hypothetical protein
MRSALLLVSRRELGDGCRGIGYRSAGNAPPAQKVGILRLDSKDSLNCGARWCNGLAFPEFIGEGEIEGMGKREPSGIRTQAGLKKGSTPHTTPLRHYSPTPHTTPLCSSTVHHLTTSLVQPPMPGCPDHWEMIAFWPWDNINSCLERATRGTAKLDKLDKLDKLAKLAKLAKGPRLFPTGGAFIHMVAGTPATVLRSGCTPSKMCSFKCGRERGVAYPPSWQVGSLAHWLVGSLAHWLIGAGEPGSRLSDGGSP